MAFLTLLDIAKRNGNDLSLGLIEEGVKVCPELTKIPGRPVAGIEYTYLKRTGRPPVGFRKGNAGVESGKSTYEQVRALMYMLTGIVEVDKGVADADEQGPEALQGDEANGVAQSLMEAVGAQVWDGTAADSMGFQGVKQALDAFVTLADGGRVAKSDTTSGSGNTSVYLVRYGRDGLSFDFGKNANLELSEFRVETKRKVVNGVETAHPVYVADLNGWIGLRLSTVEGAMRIANVREQDGKDGLSDKIIAKALRYWRGRSPDAIWMNREAAYLLQASRSVTIMSGADGKPGGDVEKFAPMPTEVYGIPIVITDSIGNAEAFVA